ncbi:MAG: methyltransferase domain-containing protein [Candidatus Omnitrophica bacterium]|nr:methyltransferase domain-containing protein [Candidatus Omnitrophota bacterium]
MKTKLLDLVVCPMCKGKLICKVILKANQNGIEEGVLKCTQCKLEYPIKNGIPRLFIEGNLDFHCTRTKDRFNYEWKKCFNLYPMWDAHFKSYLDTLPLSLITGNGKIGLDAGCGMGRTIAMAARFCKEIVGIDLSDNAVDAAYKNTSYLSNVHIVQADICHLPFREFFFDFIYSFGVLHHLRYPEKGFKSLAKVTKSNSPVVVYVYKDWTEESMLKGLIIRLIGYLRYITTKLPPAVLYLICVLISPLVYILFVLPRKLLDKWHLAISYKMPFRQCEVFAHLPGSLFDRFQAPIENRYKRSELLDWFKRENFNKVNIKDLFGHVAWGFKP